MYTTVAINVERFNALRRSKRWAEHVSRKYLLPSFVTASVVYNLPKFLELEMNEAGNDVVPTDLRSNTLYSRGYIFW